MLTQLFLTENVHIPAEATIEWGEPHAQKGDPESWVVDLKVWRMGGGQYYVNFFGTEEQVRAIAGGCQAPEIPAVDPAQLDALADEPAASPAPPMTDLGSAVFDLGVALNRAGVARW